MTTAPQLDQIAGILKRHLPSAQYSTVLFGSRATGQAQPGSDWDIGILGPERLRSAVVQAIRDDLNELRTLHTFDVVDLTTVPTNFRDIALKHAVKLV